MTKAEYDNEVQDAWVSDAPPIWPAVNPLVRPLWEALREG